MRERIAMQGLMAIAAREVSERVALLGLAVVVAAVPVLGPWIGIGDRPLLGVLLGVVMVFAAAVLTGSSVIARDLAEGRLGFFLARPVPWWSIWGGKMLAAVVLTFSAGAIVLAPSAAAEDWQLPPGGWWVRILVPGLIAVIGAVNVMTVGYRARRSWFAADLAMTAALVWIVIRTSRGLLAWGVWVVSYDYVAPALWILAAAVTLAGAVQVPLGRADIARSHRVMSIALWAVLAPAVLAFTAWGTWVQRMGPADVRSVLSAWSAPKGSWIVVTGRAGWSRPESLSAALLVDTSRHRFRRLGPGFSPLRPPFTSDATRAAWVSDPFGQRPRLTVADLASGEPVLSEVPLPVPSGSVLGFALSPDGRHAAVAQGALATVFALGSQQTAGTLPLGNSRLSPIVFDVGGRAHVLSAHQDFLSPGTLDILVLDPATRTGSVAGHLRTSGNPLELWSPGGERVAVIHRPKGRPSFTLHDGTTGALLATLLPEGRARHVAGTFLRDGRVAVVESGRGVILRVFSAEGAESWSLDVSPDYALARATEVGPGVLAVELPFQGRGRRSDTVLVDETDGRVMRRESGLRPAASSWFAWVAEALPDDGSLFVDDRGALVRLDVAIGARHRLLGGE
jgi:hypothetical protein